jgi:hypothetical protein
MSGPLQAASIKWRLWIVSAFCSEYGKHVRIRYAFCRLLSQFEVDIEGLLR